MTIVQKRGRSGGAIQEITKENVTTECRYFSPITAGVHFEKILRSGTLIPTRNLSALIVTD